jgi:hypothetical protein
MMWARLLAENGQYARLSALSLRDTRLNACCDAFHSQLVNPGSYSNEKAFQ